MAVTLAVTGALSWAAGVVAYVLALAIFYGGFDEGMEEVRWIIVYSALVCLIVFPAVYIPLMRRLWRRRGKFEPIIGFSVLGAALFFVPSNLTAVFLWMTVGGYLTSMLDFLVAQFSPEFALLHAMYIVAGGLFGVGFALVGRRHPAPRVR